VVFDDNCRCYQVKFRVDYLFQFLCGWCLVFWLKRRHHTVSLWWMVLHSDVIHQKNMFCLEPMMLNAQWCLFLDSGAIKSSIYGVENMKENTFICIIQSAMSNVWLQFNYIFICQSDSCIAHIFLHWHGGMWMDNVYRSKCVHITISVPKSRAVKNWGQNIIISVCELYLKKPS